MNMLALATVEPVPAPLWLITGLHAVTLVLHMAAMNLLVASAWHLAVAKTSELSLQRRMAAAMPPIFAITVTLGVAPLLFLQLIHGERFYASSIFMAWPWLIALLVLMVGYGVAYVCEGRARGGKSVSPALRWLPFSALAVFAFVLVANVSLADTPAVQRGLHDTNWTLAIFQTGMLPRYLHTLIGAVALGSVLLTLIGDRVRHADQAHGVALMRRGALTAIVATCIGVLFGVWQLLESPKDVGGPLPGIFLTFGILAGLATPVFMTFAWRRESTRFARLAALSAGLALALKTGLRLAIRSKRLAEAEDVEELTTATQVTPIVWFAVCLLLALVVVGWLVRVMRSAAPESER